MVATRPDRNRLEALLIEHLGEAAENAARWAQAWDSWAVALEHGKTTESVSATTDLEDLHQALARHEQMLLDQQVKVFRQIDRLALDDPNRHELWDRWLMLKALRTEIDEILFPPGVIGVMRRKRWFSE